MGIFFLFYEYHNDFERIFYHLINYFKIHK
jgi:hypothetical protein